MNMETVNLKTGLLQRLVCSRIPVRTKRKPDFRTVMPITADKFLV